VKTICPKLRRVAWTVRYLKACQIEEWVRRRVVRSLERYVNANDQAVAKYAGCAWPSAVSFLPPRAQGNRADAICKGYLRFLNAEATVGFPPKWHSSQLPKLWQYNLHYFEWLWALNYWQARSVVLDWIEKYHQKGDAIGWEPYPTSLRLVNWCALFFGRFRGRVEGDHAFMDKLWSSVCRQAQWLTKHLETHLLGNHYLENGAALAFVGSCFKGERARRWFEKGYGILQEQIHEQILPDGMHFELSPMYHCRVMYVLAMLMATGNRQFSKLIVEPLERMVEALNAVCHPDGQIALLSDSAFGIYNEPAELRSFWESRAQVTGPGREVLEGCFSLSHAGYYGWRDQKGNYIVCDAGKIGPDYIPGHGHADIFSYELSLASRRVVVDSGVHNYEVSCMRQYNRSTEAHNTVEINGQDQCEMWRSFRVARRGYPHDVSCETTEDGFQLSGWHDGYGRLPGKPVHHRFLKWTASEGLAVYDTVTTSKTVQAVSRIHLHPDCAIVDCSDRAVIVACGEVRFRVIGVKCDELKLEQGWYCPEFGCRHKTNVICLSSEGKDVEIGYRLIRLKLYEKKSESPANVKSKDDCTEISSDVMAPKHLLFGHA